VASRLSLFLTELKRRKVYHVGVTYVVVAAGIIGFGEAALGGTWEQIRLVVLALLAIGFPIALVLAWAYEVRPEERRAVDISASRHPSPDGAIAPRFDPGKSVVVLPFDNHSPDPGDAYFADGLTEEIITELSYLGTLRVISRNSAMAVKGTNRDVRAIGRELETSYVLEGSVRKSGDDLRITAQLIDATSDAHVWAERYDGVLDDIFEIQERVSRSIAEALSVRITPEESRRIAERPMENVRAYEAYLRVRYETNRFTREGLDRALREANNALELWGENSLLLYVTGIAYWSFVNYGLSPDYAYLDKAEEMARRIFELDPESPHGHRLRGMIHYKRGEMREAIRFMEAARKLDPVNLDALALLNYWYGDVGRIRDMPALVRRLTESDPLDLNSRWADGWHELIAGRFPEAVTAYERMLKLFPENPLARFSLGHALAHAGREAEACDQLGPLAEQASENALGLIASLLIISLDECGPGRPEPLTEASRAPAWTDEYLSWIAAEAYARAADLENSIAWLDRAMNLGFVNHPFVTQHDRFFDPIRSEPRFRALMSEMESLWRSYQPQGA
jgi:TolB-like protein